MRHWFVMLLSLALIACDRAPHSRVEKMDTFNVEEPVSAPMGYAPSPSSANGPRIAYSYSVTYDFDERTIAKVQGQQLALCRKLGPTRCLVMSSSLDTSGPDDLVINDEAVLLIDAHMVPNVNQRLDALATESGARVASRQVEAEDVTRQVIDTDARVRAKQALAERLLTIIRAGKGNVGELVQAERAYATTQEELDAARAAQADLAQRVAMSRVTISYHFSAIPSDRSPILQSLFSAGETLSASIASLITLAIGGLPWLVAGLLILALLRWIAVRRGWRWPLRRRSA